MAQIQIRLRLPLCLPIGHGLSRLEHIYMKLNRVLVSSGVFVTCVAPFVLSCLPAQGATVPAASSLVDCTKIDGSHVGGTSSCAVDRSIATVTTAPAVALTASAAYDAVGPGSASGFAVLTYSFAVLGGLQDTIIPVDIDFALQALVFSAGPSPVYALASISANSPLGGGYAVICNSGCADSSSSLNGTFHFNVLAGETNNTVSLEVEASAGGYADIPANFSSAYADPRIYIDPTFANSGDYSIVVSDGVGNGLAAAVPEPDTMALMLGGLSFVGWVAKRRKRGWY